MIYRPNLLLNSRVSKTSEEKKIYKSPENEKKTDIGLSKYYSLNNETYDTSNELGLISDLQKEQIKTYGYNVTYIIRTQNMVDKIYGESIGTTFKHSFVIAAKLEDSGNLFEDNPSLLDYGFVNPVNTTIYIPIDILDKEIQKQNIENRRIPLPGDLIYLNIANMLFEIKNVVWNYTKYNKGQNTLYKFVCTLFNMGDEKFDVENKELNKLNDLNKLFDEDVSDNKVFKSEASDWQLNFNEE